MKKTVILSIFLFLFSISIAYADDVNLNYTIINNKIPPGASAEFVLSIENTQLVPEDFTLDITDSAWNVKTDPLTDYTTGIHVRSQSTYTTKLLLNPVKNLGFNNFYVQANLISQATKKTYSIILPIEIRQDLVRYPLDLGSDISMPTQIDPRKTFSIKISLSNKQPSILKNISVTLNSDIIQRSSIVDLGPEEEKTIDFSIRLDETTKPQKDTLVITLSKDGNFITTFRKDFEIVSVLPPYKQTESVRKRFFVYTSTIELLNEGNTQETQTVLIPLKRLDSILADTVPGSSIVQQDGDAYFAWNIALGPAETTTVQIKRNYQPIILLIITAIIFVILYYLYRSPLTVKKKAKKISAQGEHITGIKIVLHVKNRSRKPIHSIRLIDRVPNLVGFVRAGMETAKPNQAAPHPGGTVVAWDIAVVEPGEERVFTYELKPKLDVVGGLDLGPAIINFRKGNRYFKKKSNSLDVYV